MVKNENGITLVEVLCALALLSIIVVLASSVQLFGQKQVKSQVTNIQNQSNVRLALNMITTDIRSGKSVSALNNVLTITLADNSTIVYQLNGNTLTKNNQPVISDVQSFILTPDTNFINVKVISNNVPPISLTTTIYYRK